MPTEEASVNCGLETVAIGLTIYFGRLQRSLQIIRFSG